MLRLLDADKPKLRDLTIARWQQNLRILESLFDERDRLGLASVLGEYLDPQMRGRCLELAQLAVVELCPAAAIRRLPPA